MDWRPAALCGKTQASQLQRKEKGPWTGKNTFWSINAKSLSGLLVTGGAGLICLFPPHTRGDIHKKKKKKRIKKHTHTR